MTLSVFIRSHPQYIDHVPQVHTLTSVQYIITSQDRVHTLAYNVNHNEYKKNVLVVSNDV